MSCSGSNSFEKESSTEGKTGCDVVRCMLLPIAGLLLHYGGDNVRLVFSSKRASSFIGDVLVDCPEHSLLPRPHAAMTGHGIECDTAIRYGHAVPAAHSCISADHMVWSGILHLLREVVAQD